MSPNPNPEPDPDAPKAALNEAAPAPGGAGATAFTTDGVASSSTGGTFDVATIASQVVSTAHEALVTAAGFPQVPAELSVDFLHGVDPSALSPEECDALRLAEAAEKRLLALFDQVQSILAARKAQCLAKGAKYFDLLGKRSGQKSFADQRAQSSGKTFHAAKAEVLAAQALDRNPGLKDDIESGELTTDQVAIAAAAIDRDKRRNPKTLTAEQEAELLASGKGKSGDQFAKEVNRYFDKRSASAHDASIAEQRARRYFTFSSGAWGMKFKGQIDAVSAQSLKTALNALMPAPSPDDDRLQDQRQADALVDLAKTVIDQGTLKAGAHVRPHVSVILTEQSFAQATKELARRKTISTHRRQTAQYEADLAQYEVDLAKQELDADQALAPVKPEPPAPLDPEMYESLAMDPAEYEDGTTLPLNELSRILCDSDLTRIVLNAEGAVMNLGRTERLYTKVHRRAVIARDKGCVFEGCNVAVQHCEIHHIKYWKRDNGDTSIENAALVCRYHHSRIHDEILVIIKDSAGLPHAVLATDIKPIIRGPVLTTAGNHEPKLPGINLPANNVTGIPVAEPPQLDNPAGRSGTDRPPITAVSDFATSPKAPPPKAPPPKAPPPKAPPPKTPPPKTKASTMVSSKDGPQETSQLCTGTKKKSAKQKVDSTFDLFSNLEYPDTAA